MHDAQYYEYTAKRRVASFGASYDFESRQLHDAAPVPAFLIPLRKRVAERVAHFRRHIRPDVDYRISAGHTVGLAS